MEQVIKTLKEFIPLIQEKHNKKIWISTHCPFTGERSDRKNGRPFRLNTKLKVGKCFHCGKSFKENWLLQKQIGEIDFKWVLELKLGHSLASIYTEEQRKKLLEDYYNNEKAWLKGRCFEKFEIDDEDLPF